MAAMARRTLAGVILYGLPLLRPRALAEVNPALVRSEMSSRSNSARATKIPKTNFPEAAVVSRAAPSPVRILSQIPRSVRLWTVFTRWRKSRPSRLSFHTNKASPRTKTIQAGVQLRPVVLLTRQASAPSCTGCPSPAGHCTEVRQRPRPRSPPARAATPQPVSPS